MVDGITNASSTPLYATESNDTMGKDAFLELMIAQLQNQDPLEPMDGTDYSAQLAQFSSLEQLQNINDSINQSIDANYLLTQSINNTMTAGLIGKDVKIAGDTVSYIGQDNTNIGYELPADARGVEVKVYDEAGQLVKTFTDLEENKGEYKLSWDFTDDSGNKLSHGNYRVEIDATTLDGSDMVAAQYFVGNIDGVRFTNTGTAIMVNGVEYAISDVFEILERDEDSESTDLTGNTDNNDDGHDPR
ncbi:MAG: flagellar hook capping protein [Ignavibacteriae bacterium]|nr:flagellar hook capping protein [Ignavibacteriota bacterium]